MDELIICKHEVNYHLLGRIDVDLFFLPSPQGQPSKSVWFVAQLNARDAAPYV